MAPPETNEVPKAALELGADVSAGQYLYPDLQEDHLLYINSSTTMCSDTGTYVNGHLQHSIASNQVPLSLGFQTIKVVC